MGYGLTLGVLVSAIAVFVAAMLISRRTLPLGEIRLVPYGAIQFVALVVAVLMIAHLVSLVTGHPFTGRMGGRLGF